MLIECDSPEYSRILTWAWLAIAIYPIAWTVTTAVLLYLARSTRPDLLEAVASLAREVTKWSLPATRGCVASLATSAVRRPRASSMPGATGRSG